MKILKNFATATVLLGLALGIVWLLNPPESQHRQPQTRDTADTATPNAPLQTQEELLALIQESPENLVALERAQEARDTETAPTPLPQHLRESPLLFSEKAVPVKPATEPKPSKVTDLYFWDDFASLRTETVRNPDSPENRATVETIMQKRAQRLAEEN